MSKIETLLRQLCPNGVEYKKLGDVGTFTRGNGLQKKDFTESGVGCIHYGQVYTHYGLYAYETKSFVTREFAKKLRKAKTGDLVVATTSENDEDVCKAVAWLGKDEIAVSGDALIYSHSLEPKYVSYFFQSENFQTQKMPHITGIKVRRVNGDALEKFVIPVPPMEIQAEIVRVLDIYSTLEAGLEAELEAELEARRKQYQYYRDFLLTLKGQEVEWVPLEELCHFVSSGKNKVKSAEGKYPVFGSTGVIARTNEHVYDKEQILIARVGANAGYVHLADGKYDVSDNTIIVNVKENYSLKFLFYVLVNMKLRQYAKGGGQPLITSGQLKEFKIPIPYPDDPEKSLAEQTRVGVILDKFDALVNDISKDLSAEIRARRQQYEYYRDQLLACKRGV